MHGVRGHALRETENRDHGMWLVFKGNVLGRLCLLWLCGRRIGECNAGLSVCPSRKRKQQGQRKKGRNGLLFTKREGGEGFGNHLSRLPKGTLILAECGRYD